MPRQKSLMGEPILCNALSAIMSCVENPDPGLVGACSSGDGKGSYTLAVLYFSLELKREQERLYKRRQNLSRGSRGNVQTAGDRGQKARAGA